MGSRYAVPHQFEPSAANRMICRLCGHRLDWRHSRVHGGSPRAGGGEA